MRPAIPGLGRGRATPSTSGAVRPARIRPRVNHRQPAERGTPPEPAPPPVDAKPALASRRLPCSECRSPGCPPPAPALFPPARKHQPHHPHWRGDGGRKGTVLWTQVSAERGEWGRAVLGPPDPGLPHAEDTLEPVGRSGQSGMPGVGLEAGPGGPPEALRQLLPLPGCAPRDRSVPPHPSACCRVDTPGICCPSALLL